MLSREEFDLLKQCILNNPRSTLYVSGEETNIYNVNDPEKMQKEFLSKLSLIETSPNCLTADDYTNLRLYVTDEFLSPAGWDSKKSCPTEYGLMVDKLLNKLSHLADRAEKQ